MSKIDEKTALLAEMKEMTISEIRKCELGILDYIDKICKLNDLKYWIDYGTLLGAVRHKGFIPWDDDIDIAMLREDYDKLISVCRDHSDERYRFSCVENDVRCMYPFGKMIDTFTELYELGENGIKIGVYVDIFVYDGPPDNERIRKKAFRKLEIYGLLRKCQLPIRKTSLSFKYVCAKIANFLIKLLLPRQYFTRKIVNNARKYGNSNSDSLCILIDPYSSHWIVKKSMFNELIELPFEGKKYRAPKAYDMWLKIQYGNYMRIPPLEKRIRHTIKAYYKD